MVRAKYSGYALWSSNVEQSDQVSCKQNCGVYRWSQLSLLMPYVIISSEDVDLAGLFSRLQKIFSADCKLLEVEKMDENYE